MICFFHILTLYCAASPTDTFGQVLDLTIHLVEPTSGEIFIEGTATDIPPVNTRRVTRTVTEMVKEIPEEGAGSVISPIPAKRVTRTAAETVEDTAKNIPPAARSHFLSENPIQVLPQVDTATKATGDTIETKVAPQSSEQPSQTLETGSTERQTVEAQESSEEYYDVEKTEPVSSKTTISSESDEEYFDAEETELISSELEEEYYDVEETGSVSYETTISSEPVPPVEQATSATQTTPIEPIPQELKAEEPIQPEAPKETTTRAKPLGPAAPTTHTTSVEPISQELKAEEPIQPEAPKEKPEEPATTSAQNITENQQHGGSKTDEQSIPEEEKENIRSKDESAKTYGKDESFLKRNRKPILITLCLVGMGLILAIGYNFYLDRH